MDPTRTTTILMADDDPTVAAYVLITGHWQLW